MREPLTIPGCIYFADLFELDTRLFDLPQQAHRHYHNQVNLAAQDMRLLLAGERVNTDENRAVGHYWLRDAENAPLDGEKITMALEQIEAWPGTAGDFEQFLWIGIGGSGLAPQLLQDALRSHDTPPMHWFDNTDPDGFSRVLADLGDLRKTLTVVVSKSGGTQETANGMIVAEAAYRAQELDFAQHAVAVTQPENSKLLKIATGESEIPGRPVDSKSAWLQAFPIWDWVGGRTSLFSAVGLLAAKLMRFDPQALLDGAAAVDAATDPDIPVEENPAMQMALAWYHAVHQLGRANQVVLPYFDRLGLFGKYLQQLIMESIGKSGQGISVFGNKGTTDQHSFVQQLRDGRNDYFATFIRVLDGPDKWRVPVSGDKQNPAPFEVSTGDFLAAFQEGTARALHDAGRVSMRLTIDQFGEKALGGLVALYERTVSYYASMIGLNAYHQPGVEAGKRAADGAIRLQHELLTILAEKGPQTIKQLASATKHDASLVASILERLSRLERGVVLAEPPAPGTHWTAAKYQA